MIAHIISEGVLSVLSEFLCLARSLTENEADAQALYSGMTETAGELFKEAQKIKEEESAKRPEKK